jgi:O-antigen chain-terminating methyltransferase
MAATREHTEAAVAAAQSAANAHAEAVRASAQQHAEELTTRTRDDVLAEIAAVRRELRTQQRLVRGAPSNDAPAGSRESSDSSIDAGFYVALEDRFRGTVADIAKRQSEYVDLVAGCVDDDHPVIDLGCGRGEWLRLPRDAGVRAVGVDNNPAFVAENRDDALDVVQADLLAYLAEAADDSAGAITLFQVVEHIEFATLLDLFEQAARVVRPGGLLLAETPNALNLQIAASNFWIDPTHRRPLHPEFLQFCALRSGFSKVEGLFVNELDPAYHTISDATVRRLAERLDGPGDFTLLAWK